MSETTDGVRTRDPARKERILSAAAELLAQRGFHSVAMSEIGAAAGVTGSAIYRHFDNKSAVLTALFDRVIDALLRNASRIVVDSADETIALCMLVREQVAFVISDRRLAQVYHNEIHNLPEDDRRRLRRKQRLYLEEWVHVLGELRPGLTDTEVRAVVHAAIGTIQSALFYDSGLDGQRLAELLADGAHAVLGVPRRQSSL